MAAADESTANASAVSDPKVRFLFLTPASPILIEASIHLDGKPFRRAYEELALQVLKSADTDGDGQSTWREAVANPRFAFGYFTRNERNPEGSRKYIDRNRNGVLEIDEARHVVTGLGRGPVFEAVQGAATYSRSDIKTTLDVTGDGVISESELESAREQLMRRDTNRNGLLETREVGGGAPQEWFPRQIDKKHPPVITVYRLDTPKTLDAAYRGLLDQYAGTGQVIGPGDIRWFPDFVLQLDLNQNGSLELEEMAGLQKIQPHLVIDVNLGESDVQPAGIRLVAISKVLQNRDRISREFTESVELKLPELKLTLAAPNCENSFSLYKANTVQEAFSEFDVNRNGYIGEDDVAGVDEESGPYLRRRIERWDSDGDGVVFPREIESYCRIINLPQLNSVHIQASNHRPSFFSVLDETGDNRLSLREMKNAPQRLKEYDRDGDGKLTVDELPVVMNLTFQRSFDHDHVRARTPGNFGRATSNGPAWFVRMDQNFDGDVNTSEFLGDFDTFKQLDANSDGFIERKEAEAASAITPQK